MTTVSSAPAPLSENTHYIRHSQINKDGVPDTTFSNIKSRSDLLMEAIGPFFENKAHLDALLPIIQGKSKLSLRLIDWFVTNYTKKHSVTYERTSASRGNRINTFIAYISYKAQLKAYSKKQFDPFCRKERIWFFVKPEKSQDSQDSQDYRDSGSESVVQPIETTVGQLNFFRWAIDNGVIDYIEKNREAIENDMNQSSRGRKKGPRRKKPQRGPTVTETHETREAGEAKNSEASGDSGESLATSLLVNGDHPLSEAKDGGSPKNRDLTLLATKKVNKHNVTITVRFD